MSDFKAFNRQRIEILLGEHAALIGAGKLKQAHFKLAEIVQRLIAHAEACSVGLPGLPGVLPAAADLGAVEPLDEIEQKVGRFIRPEKPVLLLPEQDADLTLLHARIEALEKKLETEIAAQTVYDGAAAAFVADERQGDLEDLIRQLVVEAPEPEAFEQTSEAERAELLFEAFEKVVGDVVEDDATEADPEPKPHGKAASPKRKPRKD